MNTTKSGRRILNGLIIWKKYYRQLSPEETEKEIMALENEGFEFSKVLSSDTVIVCISSDGQSFSKAHLRQVDVHWKRLVETNIQLTSIVRTLDHRKLEEWE
jgi:hypothetical protein